MDLFNRKKLKDLQTKYDKLFDLYIAYKEDTDKEIKLLRKRSRVIYCNKEDCIENKNQQCLSETICIQNSEETDQPICESYFSEKLEIEKADTVG